MFRFAVLAVLGLAACATPAPPAVSASPPAVSASPSPPAAPTPTPGVPTPGPPARPERCADVFAAARDGDGDRLAAWATAGADLDAACGSRTSLMLAAMTCDTAAVALLLDAGADPRVCVPLPGKTTCGSSGGLGGSTHSLYPLGEAERALEAAERAGRDAAACRSTRDRLAPLTGRVPDDLRPASRSR